MHATHVVSFILTFLPADLMAESARVRREAQEAKTQAGEDKQEAEQDSTKMAAEGLEGDDLQDKEPKEEPGSQGSPWFIPGHFIFISVFILYRSFISLDNIV